ncbi:hypothetical protein JET18_21665 [Chryseobacterium sp. L7]|uniref:Uncharacterized protein n=1 Tax=Chryseobacterium endalhagicum TaxID=2797638 RepID=A0ABS1QLG4_9FLAO|nr:DUF6493 family protein [Chryseobacterium endalhagicum]MBL1223461.1 hypothetical protein [Chryseobacterium endalhagicum]
MLIEDELKRIYLNYKIKEIIPFLKKLTPKEKKETAVILKKFLNKDWGHNHVSMLALLASSPTQDQYEKQAPGYYALPVSFVDELFESYVPEWIGNSYPFLRNIDYLKVIEWEKKGYLTLRDEVCAHLLSESIFSTHTTEEILFTYPETLEAHIWLLFQYNSEITANPNSEKNWKSIVNHLVGENKLERLRVLQSCLNAISLNFSKDHNIWFLELFSDLKPAHSEILGLQDQLFSIFHATQHSLFVPVLKILSPILTEKDFKNDDFLNAIAPLASIQVKTVLNALMQSLEKIAKNNKKYGETISLFLMPVFLNKDAAIQIKAAKIIAKYADPDSEHIKNEIQSYAGSLLSDAVLLLDKFLLSEKNQKEDKTDEHPESTVWHVSQPVSPIETVEELMFFAPQVFSHNNPNDFDLFIDVLMRLNPEINPGHITQLDPAFKAALKIKGGSGMHHLYASFFVAYGLMKREKPSPVLIEAKKEFPDLENWVGKRTPLIFKAYQQLLLGISELLKKGKKLPLLSLPDKTPCWIDPHVLVDRLKIYQTNEEFPVPFDLERAILRVKNHQLEELKEYARKELSKDYYKLLEPLFDPEYFTGRYEKSYLEGNFDRKTGTRKIYKGYVAEEIPELTVTIENKAVPDDGSLLEHLFNSYHGVYDLDLIRILHTAPHFSGSVFAKKYNETLSNSVYQYDSRTNTEFLDAWMQLDLPWQQMHYLFLSAGMFSKDKTFSGTAFEALIGKIISDDFDTAALGLMIGEKINFGLVPVKRLTDGLTAFTGLNPSHNRAFEKLLISILTTVNQPVFNLKKLLEIYDELLHLNQAKTDSAVAVKLKEWQNENNLKKIIIKLKTNERKTL